MKAVLLLMCCLMLGSCMSPPVRYYKLPQTASVVQEPLPSQKTLVIPPVRLSSALDSRQMVYQLSETQFAKTQQHRWLSDLQPQLTNFLIQAFKQQSLTYWAESVDVKHKDAPKLWVSIERFDFSPNRYATVQGTWTWAVKGKKPLSRDFQYSQPLVKKGYEAVTRAYADLLTQLVKAINSQINKQ